MTTFGRDVDVVKITAQNVVLLVRSDALERCPSGTFLQNGNLLPASAAAVAKKSSHSPSSKPDITASTRRLEVALNGDSCSDGLALPYIFNYLATGHLLYPLHEGYHRVDVLLKAMVEFGLGDEILRKSCFLCRRHAKKPEKENNKALSSCPATPQKRQPSPISNAHSQSNSSLNFNTLSSFPSVSNLTTDFDRLKDSTLSLNGVSNSRPSLPSGDLGASTGNQKRRKLATLLQRYFRTRKKKKLNAARENMQPDFMMEEIRIHQPVIPKIIRTDADDVHKGSIELSASPLSERAINFRGKNIKLKSLHRLSASLSTTEHSKKDPGSTTPVIGNHPPTCSRNHVFHPSPVHASFLVVLATPGSRKVPDSVEVFGTFVILSRLFPGKTIYKLYNSYSLLDSKLLLEFQCDPSSLGLDDFEISRESETKDKGGGDGNRWSKDLLVRKIVAKEKFSLTVTSHWTDAESGKAKRQWIFHRKDHGSRSSSCQVNPNRRSDVTMEPKRPCRAIAVAGGSSSGGSAAVIQIKEREERHPSAKLMLSRLRLN